MNSTELGESVTEAINTFHHVSGVIFLLVNLLVCFLIIFDNDPRGKMYRKYVLSLQISSMIVDLSLNVYIPILLISSRLLYSESWLAQQVDITTFGAIVVCIFAEVVVSYFACVYYRRCAVLPPGSRFCFVGRRRTLLFLSLQLYTAMITAVLIITITSARALDKDVPSYLKWVTKKSSYIFVRESSMFIIGGIATVLCYLCLTIVTVIMIGQVLIELKQGMHHASTSTKRYQKRAAVSLMFQGLIPNMIYVIPVMIAVGLYLNTMTIGLEKAANNQTISAASALLFNIVPTHTLAHSLTILAFSPAYRNTVLRTLRISRPSLTPRQSMPFLHSISKPFDR